MITIRSVVTADITACMQIFIDTYNRMPWNYRWENDKAIKYIHEYMTAPGFTGFVICDDDIIVGAMLGHIKTWWINDQLYIDELFIDPAKQGCGYGKQIMAHCERYCKEKGVEMIMLMTNKLMPAYEFYVTNDYMKVEQYVFMFKQL